MFLLQMNGFKVGKIYRLKESFYKHEPVELTWISNVKNIKLKDGGVHRQIQCRILSKNVVINSSLEYLENLDAIGDFKSMSNNEIIKLVRKQDKQAVREFIKRFKKFPKFKS